MLANTVIKILLNVVLISTFIGIFFFTYETKIEQDIVEIQSTDIIKDISGNLKTVLNHDDMEILYNNITPYLVAPNLQTEDEYVKVTNKALLKKATKLMAYFCAISLTLLIISAIMFKVNMKDILISSIVTLVFVAIIEFIFLTFMVKNYKTIDANFVKFKIIQTLANYN
jgi:hypothetical protein